MIKGLSSSISAAAMLLLTLSCTGSKFTKEEGTQELYPSREIGCELKYFTKMPEDFHSYQIIGECSGKGTKGLITSEFESALKRVEECACENGGNAILLKNSFVEGHNTQQGGYIQSYAVVNAVVLHIKE